MSWMINGMLKSFALSQCCLPRFWSVVFVCFWPSWIRIWIHLSEVRIRILQSSSKDIKKTLDSYWFVTLFSDFFSFKMMYSKMYLLKVICKFFFAFLKVTDENSRIRSWIRVRYPEVQIRRSGSVAVFKCHGSAALLWALFFNKQ